MSSEREVTEMPTRLDVSAIISAPGGGAPPGFDGGWLIDGSREPFLSYVSGDPSVNWSAELEQLHEEASRTHFLDRWTRSAILERVGELDAGGVIADVGCSTGYLLEDLRERHPSAALIGVDLVAAGLRKAHEAVADARLLHVDACRLPLANGSVDAVVSANLLEHVPDDRRALREMARVLRPGGRAVIVVPAGPRTYDYYDRFLGHVRRYGRGELAGKCGEAGLAPLDDLHIASLLYPAFWAVKQRNRLTRSRLSGAELEARVAADIGATHDSRAGEIAGRVERALLGAGLRLPFGIRSLVVAQRGART